MPFRSLKTADLRPLSQSTLRTVPRFALVLTIAAQVIVCGTLVVASFIFLRPFQTAADAYEISLSTPVTLLITLAEFVRNQVGWILGGMLVLLGLEAHYFARRNPFTIRRGAWLALMLSSLMLPFFLVLVGGLLVLQAWAKLIASLS